MFRNFQISIQSQGCFMLLNTHSYENIPSVSYSVTVVYDVMLFIYSMVVITICCSKMTIWFLKYLQEFGQMQS